MILRHKHFLRNFFRREVLSLPAGRRRREAELVARKLAGLPVFRRSDVVALYLSVPGELDTAPLLRLCRKARKEIAVPVVFPETHRLRFSRLPPSKKLWSKNVFGIWEPAESDRRYFRPDELDLILAPGAAFTPRGDRLGSGAGYYDRFLAKHPRIPTVGLLHTVQLAARLPTADHDRRMNFLVTPDKVLRPR